ncbi:septum formation initiator [Micromonospora sp. WMMA1923]|uniref:septum formation initiator n=1 Tax=Micromonospora sp. WMMA1923 TaxID=3404125 RepID=UPI003B949E4D
MRRRTLLAVLGWLATAVVATGIGLGAIRLVGEGITGTPGGVLSQEQIERSLASPPPSAPAVPPGTTAPGTTAGPGTTAAPGTAGPGTAGPGEPATATPAPSVTPAGIRRVFSVTGGSAVAECRAGEVRLVSWAPAQGYRVSDVEQGPDDDVEVTFSGPDGEHELTLRCAGSEPVVAPDDD